MKAVGYTRSLPLTDAEALIDLELPPPQPGPRDLLVEVRAVSVNPVDTKVRMRRQPSEGQPQVLGWDAVGVVLEAGTEVQGFRPGDRVWYAGAIGRPGCNSELHLVDERIAARAPQSLDDAQAAALPLTAITAWELLFDRLRIPRQNAPQDATLLITGGAGGVGSILIQLARQLTGLTVVATASRPDTRDWCLWLGAHHVIDHTQPLAAQLQSLSIPPVRHVASLTHTAQHAAALVELLAPQGQFAAIDDFPAAAVDLTAFKSKSLSFHWELMFTRSMFETPDMAEQGRLLAEVAALVDAGTLRSTWTRTIGPIDAEHLKQAHALVESASVRGKLVLQGFSR